MGLLDKLFSRPKTPDTPKGDPLDLQTFREAFDAPDLGNAKAVQGAFAKIDEALVAAQTDDGRKAIRERRTALESAITSFQEARLAQTAGTGVTTQYQDYALKESKLRYALLHAGDPIVETVPTVPTVPVEPTKPAEPVVVVPPPVMIRDLEPKQPEQIVVVDEPSNNEEEEKIVVEAVQAPEVVDPVIEDIPPRVAEPVVVVEEPVVEIPTSPVIEPVEKQVEEPVVEIPTTSVVAPVEEQIEVPVEAPPVAAAEALPQEPPMSKPTLAEQARSAFSGVAMRVREGFLNTVEAAGEVMETLERQEQPSPMLEDIGERTEQAVVALRAEVARRSEQLSDFGRSLKERLTRKKPDASFVRRSMLSILAGGIMLGAATAPNQAEAGTNQTSFASAELPENDPLLKPGSILQTADIIRHGEELHEAGDSKSQEAVQLLATAKQQWPQAVKFEVVEDQGKVSMRPLDWSNMVEKKETIQSDLAIIGGEMESIVAAVAAADKGRQVALLYGGPLGGLNSDLGANMRYFDGIESAERSEAQRKVMEEGLGMDPDNLWAIPDGVGQKLRTFLEQNYAGRITLVQTRTLNSVHVEHDKSELTGILIEEGIMVQAGSFLDTDPEATVTEKLGIESSVETPNISYGMVFDLKSGDGKKVDLSTERSLTPEKILAAAGVSESDLQNHPELQEMAAKMREAANKPTRAYKGYITYGHAALNLGFDLYMKALALHADEKTADDFTYLNANRVGDDFNVAIRPDGSLTLNSISYRSTPDGRVARQNDHSLKKDARFAPLREVEIPRLQEYMRMVTGDDSLEVKMPDQYYVRQASQRFQMKTDYGSADFTSEAIPQKLGLTGMSYVNDFRGIAPRDDSQQQVDAFKHYLSSEAKGRLAWEVKPETTHTSFDNFFASNKSSVTPDYMGALRIQQNLIKTNEALLQSIIPATAQPEARPVPVNADTVE